MFQQASGCEKQLGVGSDRPNSDEVSRIGVLGICRNLFESLCLNHGMEQP
jgi:hypothetical protein